MSGLLRILVVHVERGVRVCLISARRATRSEEAVKAALRGLVSASRHIRATG